jgi:hypothetical protein
MSNGQLERPIEHNDQKAREVAMRRILLAATLAGAMATGGLAAAQTPTADEHAGHHPPAATAKATPATPAAPAKTAPAPAAKGAAPKGDAMMGSGMCPMMGNGGGMMGGGMGGGMMGGGMMGGMMGGGMMGAGTKVDVKKTEKGVTMTFTAPDAASAARLQKMAEAMRLMHEATAP